MYIAINHLGIDHHIAVLEEEKKRAAVLSGTLKELYTQEQYHPLINTKAIRKCLDEIHIIEESIQHRMDFLNQLNIDTQNESEQIKKILEGLGTENDG